MQLKLIGIRFFLCVCQLTHLWNLANNWPLDSDSLLVLDGVTNRSTTGVKDASISLHISAGKSAPAWSRASAPQLHAWLLVGPLLCRPRRLLHSCWELLTAMACYVVPWRWHFAALPATFQLLHSSAPSFAMPHEPVMCWHRCLV